MKDGKLQTNLVGCRVHLLTDEEAREEARKQQPPLDSVILEMVTAESWYPAMKEHRQRFGDQVGEIVAVHLDEKNRLIYTIAFSGQLVQLMPQLWRLHDDGDKSI